jgi:hypothetical protein
MSSIARLVAAGALIAMAFVAPVQAGSRAGGADAAQARRTIIAAERGNPRAQARLGFMYANGHGVPQSYDLAVTWYVRAAEQGDTYGQYLLGLMYDKGFGVRQDVILAYMWLNLSAAHAPRHEREYILRLRDAVATKMTRAQLELAQGLAVDFIPGPPPW